MNPLLDFFNQPIVLTFLSLAIGGFLLGLLSDRRARKDKIRDKAIELLTEIGENINEVSSRLYTPIRREEPLPQTQTILDEKLGNLIAQRMGVQVRSEAYLKSNDFYKKYALLIWELFRIRKTLEQLTEDLDPNQVASRIQKRIDFLRESWPLDNELLNQDHKPPYSELFLWTQMIVNRAADLLSSNLKSAIK